MSNIIQKFKEVKRFILCQRCLHIFEEMSKGLRFYDMICPNCKEMIHLMYAFKTEYDANLKKEEILNKREGKK